MTSYESLIKAGLIKIKEVTCKYKKIRKFAIEACKREAVLEARSGKDDYEYVKVYESSNNDTLERRRNNNIFSFFYRKE